MEDRARQACTCWGEDRPCSLSASTPTTGKLERAVEICILERHLHKGIRSPAETNEGYAVLNRCWPPEPRPGRESGENQAIFRATSMNAPAARTLALCKLGAIGCAARPLEGSMGLEKQPNLSRHASTPNAR